MRLFLTCCGLHRRTVATLWSSSVQLACEFFCIQPMPDRDLPSLGSGVYLQVISRAWELYLFSYHNHEVKPQQLGRGSAPCFVYKPLVVKKPSAAIVLSEEWSFWLEVGHCLKAMRKLLQSRTLVPLQTQKPPRSRLWAALWLR